MALLLVAPFLAGRARAAAWNQPEGQGVVILRGIYDTGSVSYDRQGRKVRTPRYTKRETYAYLEYGVTNWLQAIVKPDLVSTSLGGTSKSRYTGFGTSEVGAQVHLGSYGPAIFAVQGMFQLPATTRETNLALIGNTSRNTDGRALMGLSFNIGPFPSFFDGEAGYRIRSAHAPDEVHLDLTLGSRLRPDVLVLLQSFTTVPTGPGVPFFPRTTYSNMELSGLYDFNAHWSVQLGGFGTVDGRNALRERGLDLALWYHF